MRKLGLAMVAAALAAAGCADDFETNRDSILPDGPTIVNLPSRGGFENGHAPGSLNEGAEVFIRRGETIRFNFTGGGGVAVLDENCRALARVRAGVNETGVTDTGGTMGGDQRMGLPDAAADQAADVLFDEQGTFFATAVANDQDVISGCGRTSDFATITVGAGNGVSGL